MKTMDRCTSIGLHQRQREVIEWRDGKYGELPWDSLAA